MMLPNPECIETEMIRLHNLIEKLLLECRERARTIFIVIQNREEAEAHHSVPPAMIPFPANHDLPRPHNPCHKSP